MSAVKRAISLPKELDAKIRALSEGLKRSYSGLVCEAVGMYLADRERMELDEAYARYYSDPKNVKRDKELAKEMERLSAECWP